MDHKIVEKIAKAIVIILETSAYSRKVLDGFHITGTMEEWSDSFGSSQTVW